MRVAFLQSSLGIGGAERLVQTIVGGLDRARFEPLAVNLYEPGPVGDQLAAAGLTVVSGLARSRWDPRAGRRLAAALRDLQADVVYVADSALPLFWAGRLRRAAPRPRLVVGFHSTGKAAARLQHALAGAAALPVADHFVALAPSHRDFLVRRFRLAPERFTVIANGVDTARFHPAGDRGAARRSLGWPADAPVVSIIAALRPEKNHRLFLRAAAAVAARRPEARFVVVGDGPGRAALERQARSLGLGGEIAFLGARHDTPEIQRASDVAVLCSLPVVETFPVALVEALASGTPVVSTDVGSIRDIVTPEATGLLVPSGDAGALAAAIESLLADPARRARMGAAARADALARLTRERMIADYERLFLEVGSG